MSGADPDDRADDLTERYRAATAGDPDRPSEAVRQSILAQARSAAEVRAGATTLPRTAVPKRRARHLHISLAASVLVAGLATLLAWRARPPAPPAVELAEPAASRTQVQHLIPSPPATTAPATTPPATAVPETTPRAARSPASTSPVEPPAMTRAAQPPPLAPSALASSADVTMERGGARAPPAAAAGPGRVEARRSVSRPALVSAAESGDLERVEHLLRGGASTEQTDARGRTALLVATSRGDVPLVRLLLAAGARPDVVDADGDTPLAAARRQRSPELVDLLEAQGAR